MDNQKIAIIGLGRVGSVFLQEIQARKENKGVSLVGVAELGDTLGKQLAVKEGVPIHSLDGIVAQGSSLDVIFDLTGIPAVRRELREKLAASGNEHTVIASETIARVILGLVSSQPLPYIEGRTTGY